MGWHKVPSENGKVQRLNALLYLSSEGREDWEGKRGSDSRRINRPVIPSIGLL